MLKFASKNGFDYEETLSERVTHMLSDLGDMKQLLRLYPLLSSQYHIKVVSTQWLYSSVRQQSLVPEEEFIIPGYFEWQAQRKQEAFRTSTMQKMSNIHEVHSPLDNHLPYACDKSLVTDFHNDIKTTPLPVEIKFDKNHFNSNILERDAPLNHCNPKLVEPLMFLSDYWLVMGDERRALAYAKAAATIKCLPFPVIRMEQVIDLKGLGSGHSLKVIQETLETGNCKEMLVKKESEKYKVVKGLTGVYGVGSSLAEQFYSTHSIRSVEDVLHLWDQLRISDERIKYGLAYYTDLNTPVDKEMAERIKDIVNKELCNITTKCTLKICGGFRRGKVSGHDVDFLIKCDERETTDVLYRLLKHLKQKGYILHEKVEKSSYIEEDIFKKHSGKGNTMDYFEKCFCIFRCPLSDNWTPTLVSEPRKDVASLVKESEKKRSWLAVRVDLVMVPRSQWAFAVLGWTGSKLLMRLLRHHANTTLNMLLSSHGLWSREHNRLIPADSEAEVFKHLGLSYKDPSNRNF
nr:DNA-directed DNA/RNA polymerase mu-like isoform X2 [Procambarus clarkii]XP_045583876.1 DNA-directed DNA/RNA polymerase mu-like isoform X2 [Procambarus clarkii]